MLDCDCPGNTALEEIDPDACKQSFVKVEYVVIQRRDDANNTFINGTNGIEEESSWSALPDATGNTKVVILPVVETPIFAEAANLDDSENEDGVAFAIGESAQMFSAEIRRPSATTFDAIESLGCEEDLTVYFIDTNGKFMCRLVGSADHAGIRISRGTMRVKTPFREGTLVSQFKGRIEFYLRRGWYKTHAIVTPESGFDPGTEIRPS